VATNSQPDDLSPTKDEESALLDATLRLSETQLLAQIADETSLDGRTMGLLAFNGALLAADIAAKEVLGRWWWSVLPFLVFSTALCLRSAFAKNTDLGPPALKFYEIYGGNTAIMARKQLLADLDESFGENAARVAAKIADLRHALGILICGLVVAALLIGVDRPSKVSTHAKCSAQLTASTTPCSHSAEAGPNARPLGSSQSRAGRGHRPIVTSSGEVVGQR
jgi:hypothetical protein